MPPIRLRRGEESATSTAAAIARPSGVGLGRWIGPEIGDVEDTWLLWIGVSGQRGLRRAR